jgi:hypothetical protein
MRICLGRNHGVAMPKASGIPAGTYFELEVLPRGALITNPSELVGWVSQ